MTDNLSRRDFLKLSTNALLAISGLLGIGGLIRYLSYQYDPSPQSEFDIGPATNYPRSSRTLVAYVPAIVIHDDEGLRAVSLTCSHLGCTIEERNFGFECPCHSSRYDPNGIVLGDLPPRTCGSCAWKRTRTAIYTYLRPERDILYPVLRY